MTSAIFLIIITLLLTILLILFFQKKEYYYPDNYLYSDKIIWSYWHSENIPYSVYLSIKSWQKYLPEFTIYMLNNESVYQFVDLPEQINKYHIQGQTDIIRLLLLEKYGGMWIDASTILLKNIKDDWYPQNYDLGGYYMRKHMKNDDSDPVFENWFISAPKGSELIKEWRKLLTKCYNFDSFNDYSKYLIKKYNIDAQKINDIGYFSAYVAFLGVVKQKKYKLKLIEAEDIENGPLGYIDKDIETTMQNLMNTEYNYILGMIKFPKNERMYFEKNIHKFVNSKPNSLMYHILKSIDAN